MRFIAIISSLFLISLMAEGQAKDTLKINATNLNMKDLHLGTHRYLVYFKMGRDSSRSRFEFGTRTISKAKYNGRDVVNITQEWENDKELFHKATTLLDEYHFVTLYQEVWWQWGGTTNTSIFNFKSGKFIFKGEEITEQTVSEQDKKRFNFFKDAYKTPFINWHLDLEVFSLLPYKINRTFLIDFYDPGFPFPVQKVPFTVIGESELTNYEGEHIACWLLEHVKDPSNREVYWISKRSNEVLKLEQEFNGKYRYKIKLGFSI